MSASTYQYRLRTVTMNDGTVICPNKLTILIGANNSGKSRTLKDIALQTTLSNGPQSVVVKEVDIDLPSSLQDLRDAYNVDRNRDANGNWMARGLVTELTGEFNRGGPAWPDGYESQFSFGREQFCRTFIDHFGQSLVAFLTTESRLQLVKQGPSQGHHTQESHLLHSLYNAGSDVARSVSELVKRTFGREVALDFTVPQILQLRVGDDFSQLPLDPRDARPHMQAASRLDDQGDGIRSFVGICIALQILKRGLFLIDEPEAFLHPPQAFRVGAFIADQAQLSRQIIIATHSTDVLRGILSRTEDVNIIRVDRVNDKNSFLPLDADRLKEIINDPLLTSARVLDGLFYSAAVVVEADSDARFYSAASLRRMPDLDLHFVNADNKQTVGRIVRLYRDMGVRAAGIVDFDFLNDRSELEKSLTTIGVCRERIVKLIDWQREIAAAVNELPAKERLASVQASIHKIVASVDEVVTRKFESESEAERARDSCLRSLESRFRELSDSTKVWKIAKQSGCACLSTKATEAFNRIWAECSAHGIFINPTGELESMLAEFGIHYTTDKKAWITQALRLVPCLEPDDAKQPWKFLKSIHEHLGTNL